MKLIQYDGFELEHFDSAYNFRKYQVSLIKKFIWKIFRSWAGKGGLTFFYDKFIKKPTLIEQKKNFINY